MGLKLNSWSVTLPILSQSPGKGGYNLLQPEAYLHWQFAHMFVSLIRQRHKLSADIVQPMNDWSKRIGLVVHPGFLPLLQIGITKWKHVPYLELSGESFSWLKQRDEPYASPLVFLQNLPLWQNALCRNENHHTYHCPQLVRKGVVYWHDIAHDALIKRIAHTYKSPYRIAARRLLHCAHLNSIGLSCPSFWETWGSRDMVKHILTLPVGFCKESQFLWKYFKPNQSPPQLRDFIHRALWGKLSTEDRI